MAMAAFLWLAGRGALYSAVRGAFMAGTEQPPLCGFLPGFGLQATTAA
jgi:hypothetical protein